MTQKHALTLKGLRSVGPDTVNNAATAYIVKAVNNHEALVEALLTALPYVEDALESPVFKAGAVKKSIAQIRAALAAVEA